jgi:peroxiredoxin
MNLSQSMGLAFKLSDELVAKYKNEYKIDVEADSGETHHLLPVPAAYIIDSKGILQFSYYNADYKTRVNVQELLNAAREASRPF